MNKALLLRGRSGNAGTFGTMSCSSHQEKLVVFTAELPWRDNVRQLSCIPTGIYRCKWIKSPKFGWCYTVCNVPGRSGILMHAGNYAGNASKGLRTHSHGCILPASRLGVLDGQPAGLASAIALRKVNDFFQHHDFMLTIKDIEQ